MKSHAEVEHLSGYLDAALEEDERRRVEDHLAACAECRKRLEGLRRVAEQIRRLDRPVPPGDLAGRVEWRLRDERPGAGWLDRLEGGLSSHRLPTGLLGILGVVVALAVLAYLLADATARRPAVPPPAEAPVSVTRVVVADRTFVPYGEGWIEKGAPADPAPRTLEAGSEEGRRWLAEHPDLTVLERLGGPVTLEVEGEWWRLEFPAAGESPAAAEDDSTRPG